MTQLLDLKMFFSKTMALIDNMETPDKIIIRIKSKTKKQHCPKCGVMTSKHHSTYTRNITDLPVLGKAVKLDITAYKYDCRNPLCDQKVFCEDLDGFTGRYRRMTFRCEELVRTIALNTSCESASLILKHMGISISGDTAIRLLIKSTEEAPLCSEVIGVDDWAFKRREKYGTMVCDAKTRKPVTLLDGRDGSELKKWLASNKHVKVVTRDRASSYAKAIMEVLPNAIQVADRFHLHQNLFHAVKDAIGSIVPSRVEVSNMNDTPLSEIDDTSNCKKN